MVMILLVLPNKCSINQCVITVGVLISEMSRLTSEERVLESVTEELENVDIDDEEDEIPAPDPKLLKSQFRLFAKFGDTAADGATIKGRFRSWFCTNGNINSYWMLHCTVKILGGYKLKYLKSELNTLSFCLDFGINRVSKSPKASTICGVLLLQATS